MDSVLPPTIAENEKEASKVSQEDNTFKVQISMKDLQKRVLFLGLPMYGGTCEANFAQSIAYLAAKCVNLGIQLQMFVLTNESLITRARNYIADEFLRSNATHLMFIDSDVGFNPDDVITLLALQGEETPYDVIGGAYPKKNISWEKIVHAVNKGFADKDPNELAKFVGDYVFNPVGGSGVIHIGSPTEVSELGTGFMMIRRSTFEKYKAVYGNQYMYKPDHVRTANFDGTREIMCFFNAEIDPVSKRYLSEDYFFCQKARQADMKVWLCPWMQLTHAGKYIFGGSLADLARIGANATADSAELAKFKKR